MEYCTLEELKTKLGITGNSQDSELSDLITTLTSLVDLELGWNLGKKTINRRISGMGSERLLLEGMVEKVNSVNLFQNVSANVSSSVGISFVEGAIVYLDRKVPKGIKNLSIEYIRGYDEVPKDMKVFFLKYCKEMRKIQEKGEDIVKSKKVEGLGVSFFSPSEIIEGKKENPLSDFGSILKKYKNFNSISY